MTSIAEDSNTACDNTTKLILTVQRVSRDGGDYVVQCPHCQSIIGVDGEDMSEIRGEQYQHRRREYPGPRGTKCRL